MNHDKLLALMAKQREFGVDDLPGFAGRRITLRRPTEEQVLTELLVLVPNPEDPAKPLAHFVSQPKNLHTYAVDWAGFTEADLVGAAGGDDAVPFHPLLLQAWLAEHVAVAQHLSDKLMQAVVEHENRKATATKN